MTDTQPAQKAWGGRFAEPTAKAVEAFTQSITVDLRLAAADVTASKAHANMLATQGLIAPAEADAIATTLDAVLADLQSGKVPLDPSLEDVHMHLESALIARLGDPGRKVHTARSRNDQVATALRLWTRDAIDRTCALIRQLQAALVGFADRDGQTVVPGYTHLQRAQPVLFAHVLLAHVERLERDRARLLDARARVNVLPLGSAALAGTSLPIDRAAVAAALGFQAVAANSLDATSDRDFVAETTFALALVATHLSGLAEEWILWSTTEFGFLRLPDRLCTGSSIMPQKKNPDVLELIRGKTGRVHGALTAILTLLKGLPLAYNRDLQEDKPPFFDAFDTVEACLAVAALVAEGASLDKEKVAASLAGGHLDATSLMELLVKSGVPMRTAHELVGRLVKEAEARGVALSGLPDAVLGDAHPALSAAAARAVLGAENAVKAFTSFGSTAPAAVAQALSQWKSTLKEVPVP